MKKLPLFMSVVCVALLTFSYDKPIDPDHSVSFSTSFVANDKPIGPLSTANTNA